MPGMLLGASGGIRSVNGNGFSTPKSPSTASQAAFGTSSGSYPSTMSAIAPNDPFGVALWAAIIATGLLLVIRHSLPG